MNIKPIFNEELQLLKDNFNITIPQNCWKKKGGWVLVPDEDNNLINIGRLNSDFNGIITFKPSNREIPTNIVSHIDYCKNNKDYIRKIPNLEYLKDKKIVILTSTGKDSEVARHIIESQIGKRDRVFTNTSLDVSQTLSLAKQNCDKIINPKEGFYTWVQEDKQIIPSRTVRKCCDIFKEGKLEDEYDSNDKISFITGLRSSESEGRKDYTLIMKNTKWSKLAQENWNMINPIIDFTEFDVWCYLLLEPNVVINPLYKLGYTRVGCAIACPQQQSYINAMDKIVFPKMYDRWNKIKEKKFKDNNLWTVLNCTIEEYLWDGWKKGTKYRDIATLEVIKEYAEHKNISIELANKFFDSPCDNGCTKTIKGKTFARKLKTIETGLSIKFNGLNGKKLCMDCLTKELGCTKEELEDRIKEFKRGGCKMF